MGRKTRIHYSEEVRDFIWDRYGEGESITSIGRRFDRPSSSIYLILSPSGGIKSCLNRSVSRKLY